MGCAVFAGFRCEGATCRWGGVGLNWIGRDRNNRVTPAVELGGVEEAYLLRDRRRMLGRKARIVFRGVIVFQLRSWRGKYFTRSLRSVTSSAS